MFGIASASVTPAYFATLHCKHSVRDVVNSGCLLVVIRFAVFPRASRLGAAVVILQLYYARDSVLCMYLNVFLMLISFGQSQS